MSTNEDFDPAVFGGLLDDPEVEPATAMAAAMPDDPSAAPTSRLPATLGAIAALIVALLLIWILA